MSVEEKQITIAQNVPKVFNAGYEKGKAEGGFDADAYFEQKFNEVTNNGTDTNFMGRFSGKYIDDVTFKPTCDIKPTQATNMFSSCKITNLMKILEDRGVKLDTSKSITLQDFISYSTITHLPCISLESCTYAPKAFGYCNNLVFIKKLITNKDSGWTSNSFLQTPILETIAEIEGEFGTSLNMASCSKLDDLTIDNIINAYADMTGQTAPILTVHPIVKAKIEANETWLNTLINKNVTLA